MHAPGPQLVSADALSRDAVAKDNCPYCDENLQAVLPALALPTTSKINMEQQKRELQDDQDLQKREDILKNENRSIQTVQNRKPKTILPRTLKKPVLQFYHGSKVHGHSGIAKSSITVNERFWWENWKRDVRQWVLNCPHCAVQRLHRPTRQGLLRFWHPERKFQCVALDIMEVPPSSREGFKKIFVIGDLSSRYIWAVSIKTKTAKTISKVIMEEWVLWFGLRERLLTHRANSFMGDVIEEICRLLGVRKIFTSPYHAQTDGFFEPFNRTLMQDINTYVNLLNDDWSDQIPIICFRYNTTVHSDTNMTPFKVMFREEAFDFDT